MSPKRVNANQVMVYQIEGGTYPSMGGVTGADGQRYTAVPFKCVGTTTQNLEDSFNRVASGVMEEIKNAAPENRSEFIKEN